MLNEVQQAFAKEVLGITLSRGTRVEIHFRKLDGRERTLIALPSDQIPEDRLPQGVQPVHSWPDGLIRIFSEVEQDWRSIKLENIETMKVLL